MKRYLFIFLVSLIVACTPETTPFPADLPPTATQFIEPTLPPPIRYGILYDVAEYFPDKAFIEESALVTQLDIIPSIEEATQTHTVVVRFGIHEGWQVSPITPKIIAVMNSNLAPFNEIEIRNIFSQTPNVGQILDELQLVGAETLLVTPASSEIIRTQLANLGYPDGLDLVVAHHQPYGFQPILTNLSQKGISLRELVLSKDELLQAFQQQLSHLILITLHSDEEFAEWEQIAGADNILQLYTLPISYIATDDVTVEFTANGFPLVTR